MIHVVEKNCSSRLHSKEAQVTLSFTELVHHNFADGKSRLYSQYTLIYLLKGELSLDNGKNFFNLGDNNYIFLKPFTRYSITSNSNASFFSLRFEADNFGFFDIVPGVERRQKNTMYTTGLFHQLQIIPDGRASAKDALLLLLLDEMNCDFASFGTMADITAYIEQNVSAEMTVNSIATVFSYHPVHLCRLWQKCGRTLKETIDDELLRRVEMSLFSPELTVSQVAAMLKFKSANHLNKFMHYHTGKSPREFRSSQKNSE